MRMAAGLMMMLLPVWLMKYYGSTDLNNLIFKGNIPSWLISAFTASCGVILILEVLEAYLPMPYLVWAGQNSLVIMATHGTMGFKHLLLTGWKTVYGISKTPGLRYYCEILAILACLMLMEGGLTAVVNRYFPILAGKKRRGIK